MPITPEQRELKQKVKSLKDLSDAVLVFLDQLDKAMKQPESEARVKRVAELSNWLEQQNDSARFFALGVDSRTDDKAKATRAAMKRLQG